jgi:peptidoglycan/LPS O-acetylase OafA/YrhL
MRKIKYLDGLRGVAALQVVFHHFVLAFYPALFSGGEIKTHLNDGLEVWASGSPLNLIWDGNFSVTIFFILSGFVLSYKFFHTKDRKIITASAVKRYFRLALPTAFSILFAYILMKFSWMYNIPTGKITGSGWLEGFWNFDASLMEVLKQGFIGTYLNGTFEYNPVLWTIACEFIGSFLVFGFLAIFGKNKKRGWVYAFLILFLFQTYYLAFILGVLLSDVMAERDNIVRSFDKKKKFRLLLLVVGLFLASFPIGREAQGTIYEFMNFSWLNDAAVTYHILGAFLLMIVLLESRLLQKVFSLRPILFLGEISFMLYLLHFLILASFSSFLFLRLQNTMTYVQASGVTFAVSLPVIFLVSYLAYIFVDKKAVNFSRLVYQKFFKDSE